MPVDKHLIKSKLAKIDDYLKRIENMEISEESLNGNIDIQDLLTFRLQQTVETAIDIATHIIAGNNLEKPDTARSSFEVLAKNNIIGKQLADNLTFAVSFRNLAVHGYEKFDFRKLFHDYQKDIVDLKDFVGQILNYLKD